MSDLPFSKGHALGNDYIILDESATGVPLTPALVRALCDRHRGVGSDGVLVGAVDGERIRLRIFNPDGGEAEKSGNGLRIFAAWLHGRGVVGEEPFRVALPGETVEMQVTGEAGGGALEVRVEMGRATFRGREIGFVPESGEVGPTLLEIHGGERVRVQPVSVGNPHCVVFVDSLEEEAFRRIAPRLSTHPAFAAGTNVQFARVAGADVIEAWIYERGAGETLASGSSATAVAAAAARLGLVATRDLEIRMPGGSVRVTLHDDGALRLQGTAQIVYEGRVRGDVLAAWTAADPLQTEN